MTLVHHRINEGLFVVKVAVQRAFGDAGCGQNGIQVSAPKARAVHLLEGSLQQKFSCALRISRGRPPASRSFLVAGNDAYQPVCILRITWP